MGELRVAHIITQMELGGAQQNTLYTISHLDPKMFAPSLLAGPGGLLDDEARASGVPVYGVPSLVRPVRPLQDVLAFINLYRLLRYLKPHIVHTHSSKAGVLGRLAAFFAGVPVILHTFHGFGFNARQTSWVRRLFVTVEKFCGALTTHVIFVAEENQRQARQLGICRGKPSSLIRSGIKFQSPKATPLRQELHIPPGAFVVVSVGNFKPQKNPMDFARIASRMLPEGPDCYFLFAGDGELRPAVEKFLRPLAGADRVRLLGWRRDVPDILAASNVFLLTSWWEGLPRSLVEALAARLPAVAYAVDGVRDILADSKAGFLIPPGDLQTAKEKLFWLKAHPREAKAMGQHGQERVQQEFDIDRMVQQQEQLYKKLWEKVPLKECYGLPSANTSPLRGEVKADRRTGTRHATGGPA